MGWEWVRWTAALTLLTAAGCGAIIINDDDDFGDEGWSQIFTASTFDETWEATIETFEELRLPIDNLERASGVITTDWILLDDAEDYMDCDEATRNAEGRFNVFLREVADGMRVTVNASFRAEDETGRRMTCDSTGEYEDFILRRIRARVS